MKSSPFHPLVLGLAITGGLSLVSALQGRFRADLEFQAGLSAEQREILSHLSLVDLPDGNGGTQRAIRISGINLQLVNGSGSTEVADGTGNLIVGYNEPARGGARSGSHNIVCGTGNDYSSVGGIVSGEENAIQAPFAVAIGGSLNRVTAPWGVVTGGYNNWAARDFSSVAGGSDNFAFGVAAAVSGGLHNMASGDFASVTGGRNNEASGLASSVQGGGGFNLPEGNTASGDFSSISGGLGNVAADRQATVTGGRNNLASGRAASVSGGLDRIAAGTNAWSAGGLSEAN